MMRLEEFLISNDIKFKKNVPLSDITGMNLKGHLNLVASPSSIDQLKELYHFILVKNLSSEIVGGLTNTYLCEGFTREIIIQTTDIHEIKWRDSEVEVSCGYSLSKLALEVSRQGGAGFEGFVGIPGTVGAAAINNSGAFESEMSKVLKCVRIIKLDGVEVILPKDQLGYDTRYSILKNSNFGVLLSVTLDISNRDDRNVIKNNVEKYCKIRRRRNEWARKSLGSVFVGKSIACIWNNHPMRNLVRRLLYVPFKLTRYRNKAQCISEFVALGNLRFVRFCDNIGRFCWDKGTREKDFFEYIDFINKKTNNHAKLEIDIKR